MIHGAVVKLLLHYYTDSTGEGKGREGGQRKPGACMLASPNNFTFNGRVRLASPGIKAIQGGGEALDEAPACG